MNSKPRPLMATLVTAPQYPIGSLYYIWKQSRHRRPLPTPKQIEILMTPTEDHHGVHIASKRAEWMDMLGFTVTQDKECSQHIKDEVEMILHEGIPVVENLNFVFHIENIPITLREQLVRHRIGTMIDPKIGADIVPLSLMDVETIPNLAESTWWSQTSRVIPYDKFFDEGHYIVPESLKGKTVTIPAPYSTEFDEEIHLDAEEYYLNMMHTIQTAYRNLMIAGVPIEDCRDLIPVGATHGITWGVNLKAILHIFGKRSSWIAQIGIWGDLMGQMANELSTKVHPMFRMVLMPQCISKGKYVGCPVSGTNAERVSGVDGMPPCPIWVRYETGKALKAEADTAQGYFPGRKTSAWISPPNHAGGGSRPGPNASDIRNWSTSRPVEKEMLERDSKKYSELWGFDVLEGIPKE